MSQVLEMLGLVLAGGFLGAGGTILVRARARERQARAEAAAKTVKR